jgi:hypothetical protein
MDFFLYLMKVRKGDLWPMAHILHHWALMVFVQINPMISVHRETHADLTCIYQFGTLFKRKYVNLSLSTNHRY